MVSSRQEHVFPSGMTHLYSHVPLALLYFQLFNSILCEEKHIQRACMHLSTAALQILGKKSKVDRYPSLINPGS